MSEETTHQIIRYPPKHSITSLSVVGGLVITDPEIIARTCHNVNKVFCESIGDYSQSEWKDAPAWQKESAIDGVKFVIENFDTTTAASSHENWMRHKIADGWVYGEVKDPVAKTHPCMVPYDQLPVEQQTKDHLFRAIVASFLNR